MESSKHIVISLGGSLIAPDAIDVSFLSDFSKFIKEYVSKGYRFVIITGGGATARTYITAAQNITTPSNDDLDWIGIAGTRINAELLRVLLSDISYEKIAMDPDAMPVTDKPIILGGGWKPGNSSDLAAVHAALSVGAETVINLSNIDYVYTKDPRKFPDATPIKESTWSDFRILLPEKWEPGFNAPFDPVAAEKAESSNLEIAIMNGKNIENLKHYLNGQAFTGTVIR